MLTGPEDLQYALDDFGAQPDRKMEIILSAKTSPAVVPPPRSFRRFFKIDRFLEPPVEQQKTSKLLSNLRKGLKSQIANLPEPSVKGRNLNIRNVILIVFCLEDEVKQDIIEQVKGSQLKKIEAPKQRRQTRAARQTMRTALVNAMEQRRSALKEDTTPMDEEDELTSWLE